MVSTVGKAVAGLYDLDALIPILKDLGAKHKKYGIVPEHYQVVGQALQQTRKAGLGKKYNNAVKNSWQTIFDTVADVMIAGAAEASTLPELP